MVYSTFKTGGKIRKNARHIDPQTYTALSDLQANMSCWENSGLLSFTSCTVILTVTTEGASRHAHLARLFTNLAWSGAPALALTACTMSVNRSLVSLSRACVRVISPDVLLMVNKLLVLPPANKKDCDFKNNNILFVPNVY